MDSYLAGKLPVISVIDSPLIEIYRPTFLTVDSHAFFPGKHSGGGFPPSFFSVISARLFEVV
ncbi:hypothetical protein LEP1GSC058_1833 [Leptospira fainei serovar Hurstbridge str. BUT 6]|uniref:Uncharacterized protein n=1 Tax=Leptospira fainei serovar Hurstbridge str. BUT 6 TaxID=1193011 RepID=S3UZX4_9LEPT|nr:hypothetical protein LEP1GSC058_1833 [Leptospira fainei serovar Hurstbridge str. BUT 6]